MRTLQKLTVRDAYNLDLSPALIVGPDEDFSQVIKRFASSPELRGIFVAGADQQLLGVIARTDLLDWARAKLGAILQGPIRDIDKTLRLVNLMRASTAGQVMHPKSSRAGVKPEDTLSLALRRMIELDLIVLPVVDGDNRIVGDLKLSELLARVTEEEIE
jgi:CBS-domain-containing membrane protein